jgi:hypothetical protein
LIKINLLVLEEFSIYKHVKKVFPIVAPPNPGDHDLNKLEFALFQETFM